MARNNEFFNDPSIQIGNAEVRPSHEAMIAVFDDIHQATGKAIAHDKYSVAVNMGPYEVEIAGCKSRPGDKIIKGINIFKIPYNEANDPQAVRISIVDGKVILKQLHESYPHWDPDRNFLTGNRGFAKSVQGFLLATRAQVHQRIEENTLVSTDYADVPRLANDLKMALKKLPNKVVVSDGSLGYFEKGLCQDTRILATASAFLSQSRNPIINPQSIDPILYSLFGGQEIDITSLDPDEIYQKTGDKHQNGNMSFVLRVEDDKENGTRIRVKLDELDRHLGKLNDLFVRIKGDQIEEVDFYTISLVEDRNISLGKYRGHEALAIAKRMIKSFVADPTNPDRNGLVGEERLGYVLDENLLRFNHGALDILDKVIRKTFDDADYKRKLIFLRETIAHNLGVIS